MIYFIECVSGLRSRMVKIGMVNGTDRLERRFKDLQMASAYPLKILGVCHGSQQEEKKLHLRFKATREHGEWFRLSSDMADYIHKYTIRNIKLDRYCEFARGLEDKPFGVPTHYMSMADTMCYLSMNKKQVLKLIRDKELSCIKDGWDYWINPATIDWWIDKQVKKSVHV